MTHPAGGLDCVLHANPALPTEQGLAMVFNPTNRTVRTSLPLPLYLAKRMRGVACRLRPPPRVGLGRMQRRLELPKRSMQSRVHLGRRRQGSMRH